MGKQDVDIGVFYGNSGQEMAEKIMHKYGVQARLDWEGAVVGIKPNLVLPKPAAEGATTDPALVEGIITYIRQLGVSEIKILESAWVGAATTHAFKTCGYLELAEKYDIELIDLKEDGYNNI